MFASFTIDPVGWGVLVMHSSLPRALPVILAILLLSATLSVKAQNIIHVDDDAQPAGDGATWATAYNSLTDALTAAQSGDQIWVAAGRYVGNFTLVLDVELYGGFAGTETKLNQRDWVANATILDGNEAGSVVTSPPGATETTRIDGFTITNGLRLGLGWYGGGGGLSLSEASPTVANNTITGNRARHGGGLYTHDSAPTVVRNTIMANEAFESGGGLSLRLASGTIMNNTVEDNRAHAGGGVCLYGSSPTITNNIIGANRADAGGGLSMYASSPSIGENIITGNSALAGDGGGIKLSSSEPTIINTIVAGNSAFGGGGGLYMDESSPILVNNTVTANSVLPVSVHEVV